MQPWARGNRRKLAAPARRVNDCLRSRNWETLYSARVPLHPESEVGELVAQSVGRSCSATRSPFPPATAGFMAAGRAHAHDGIGTGHRTAPLVASADRR